jgi:hypothetical protein
MNPSDMKCTCLFFGDFLWITDVDTIEFENVLYWAKATDT